MFLRRRWFLLTLAVCIIVGVLAALIFIGPGIPGVARTFNAQRMPIQTLQQFQGNPLNGYITIYSAYYVPGSTTLLLQVSSQFPKTLITFLTITQDPSIQALTNCPGGDPKGGGGLPAGCYTKNAIIGTGKVWLITPLNSCGDFVVNGTIRLGMSQLSNSTTYTDQADTTSKVSGVEFQCVFPHATETLTLLAPFTEVQFGPLPAYELLTSAGMTFNSATNATLSLRNNGTMPVTLTRYSMTSAAFSGQYNSTSLGGPSIAVASAGALGVFTDSAHSFRSGYCYGVTVFTLGHSQFLFINCK